MTLPVGNCRERQAYYGAVDVLTGQMHLVPYTAADALSTADFLMDVRLWFPDDSLAIIWDNASHHKAADVRAYLAKINGDLPPDA